jgi:hypothetical protein
MATSPIRLFSIGWLHFGHRIVNSPISCVNIRKKYKQNGNMINKSTLSVNTTNRVFRTGRAFNLISGRSMAVGAIRAHYPTHRNFTNKHPAMKTIYGAVRRSVQVIPHVHSKWMRYNALMYTHRPTQQG